MDTLREKIEKRLEQEGRGYVFTRKDFQDLAQAGTIGKLLFRLAKEGKIRRLGRGLFDYPKTNSALGGKLSPDIDQAANAVARKFRWSILPYGILAANRLGLSQQVPAKYVYLSNGPARQTSIRRYFHQISVHWRLNRI